MNRNDDLMAKIQECQHMAENIELLIDKTELTEPLMARVEIDQAIRALRNAAKKLDPALLEEPSHHRVRDHVVLVQRNIKEWNSYRSGNSADTRHAVALTAIDQFEPGHYGREQLDGIAVLVSDQIAKVWSQPPASKMPSKPQLKKLGIDPKDYLQPMLSDRSKVDVWTVEEYEQRIGDPPTEDRYKGEDRAKKGQEPW